MEQKYRGNSLNFWKQCFLQKSTFLNPLLQLPYRIVRICKIHWIYHPGAECRGDWKIHESNMWSSTSLKCSRCKSTSPSSTVFSLGAPWHQGFSSLSQHQQQPVWVNNKAPAASVQSGWQRTSKDPSTAWSFHILQKTFRFFFKRSAPGVPMHVGQVYPKAKQSGLLARAGRCGGDGSSGQTKSDRNSIFPRASLEPPTSLDKSRHGRVSHHGSQMNNETYLNIPWQWLVYRYPISMGYNSSQQTRWYDPRQWLINSWVFLTAQVMVMDQNIAPLMWT